MSSPEYWIVQRISAQIFRKLGFKLGNLLQFKFDLEQNTLRNLTLTNKENRWTHMETVQHNTENLESAWTHFRPKVEREHPNTSATTSSAESAQKVE
jgi:flagellin-specific chaperone FliS